MIFVQVADVVWIANTDSWFMRYIYVNFFNLHWKFHVSIITVFNAVKVAQPRSKMSWPLFSMCMFRNEKNKEQLLRSSVLRKKL